MNVQQVNRQTLEIVESEQMGTPLWISKRAHTCHMTQFSVQFRQFRWKQNKKIGFFFSLCDLMCAPSLECTLALHITQKLANLIETTAAYNTYTRDSTVRFYECLRKNSINSSQKNNEDVRLCSTNIINFKCKTINTHTQIE